MRAIALLMVLGACGRQADLEARFTDRGDARRGVLPAAGLYYSELEIVLYDYRPGEAVQSDPNWGRGSDFSYWIPLQSGHEAARDNVLRAGDTLDLPGADDEFPPEPPSAEFASQVGAFDADLVEVAIFGSGLVNADGFFGSTPVDMNGVPTNGVGDAGPLYKYPDLADLPAYWSTMRFPGWAEDRLGSTSLVFARSDWFPAPVLVSLDRPADAYVIGWTSAPLDATQSEVLLAMANQGTQRRGYDDLIVVPYDGPARLVFNEGRAASLPAVPVEIPAAEAAVTVSFDLSHALSAASDLFADDVARFDASQPQVYWSGDAAHVPFGVSVAFGAFPATCTDGTTNGDETGVDCGGSCGGCLDPELPVDCSGDPPPAGFVVNRFRGSLRQTEDPLGIGFDIGMGGEAFEGWVALDPALPDADADAAVGLYDVADATDGLFVARSVSGWCVEATDGTVDVRDRAGGAQMEDGDAFTVVFGAITPLPASATSAQVRLTLTTEGGANLTSDDLVGLPQASAWWQPAMSVRYAGSGVVETVAYGDIASVYPSE